MLQQLTKKIFSSVYESFKQTSAFMCSYMLNRNSSMKENQETGLLLHIMLSEQYQFLFLLI